ncbi:hypothetical protein QBC47DRAFT_321207 [Echria macrotheca]|uniref:Uncharacterized protein n=1 Tax=Echria macrotheca TaxID=438768 RepID=A0AAJ0BE16_9PEZI|nr:hypothetical protein QBC47DRAFT_321207 [Echria macrotheca]
MAPTSPLTTIATMSTPNSFHTAPITSSDSPGGGRPEDTGISSPIHDDQFPGPGPSPSTTTTQKFRRAVLPVHSLRAHCQIQLEEELFLPAILLLDNLLTDGSPTPPSDSSSSSSGDRRGREVDAKKTPAARVATPQQLAILNTLTIHPVYTSRLTEPTNAHVAARARIYLQGVLALVGPINANLRAAFAFSRHGGGGSGYRRESRFGTSGHTSPLESSSSVDGSTESSESLDGRMANEQSLWRRGTDFWAVLGWAFRCAAEHPHRWAFWRGWVEFMVEVLEVDWDEREALDETRLGGVDEKNKMVKGSLLVAYLEDVRKERKNVLKEVVRALLAFTDDDPTDKVIYREVFDRELAVGTGKGSKRKRSPTVLDLDNDKFGDYFDMAGDDDLGDEDEDEEEGSPPSPSPGMRRSTSRRGRGRGRPAKQDASSTTGPRISEAVADTINIRLRLFRILSAAANALPEYFCEVGDLYGMFTDRVRGMPLPLFRLFVESHTNNLPGVVEVEILRNLVDDLLPSSRPSPASVDPDTDAENGLSPVILEKCFLPFAAARVQPEENAKLAVVLESMMWFMWARGALSGEGGGGLGRAVERGIRAREDKIRRRLEGLGVTAADREAKEVLDRSARSLRVLVTIGGL